MTMDTLQLVRPGNLKASCLEVEVSIRITLCFEYKDQDIMYFIAEQSYWQ